MVVLDKSFIFHVLTWIREQYKFGEHAYEVGLKTWKLSKTLIGREVGNYIFYSTIDRKSEYMHVKIKKGLLIEADQHFYDCII